MSVIILISFFILLFFFSYRAKQENLSFLNPKSLNWFLVAFSAGTTANTGFIVTTAVAMGYSMGISAIVLPLSFLLGDIVYWQIFAPKVHIYASENSVRTIPDFITKNIEGNSNILKKLISFSIIIAAVLYTIAQWNATGKLFSGFYNVDPKICILAFAIIVLAYCLIGGFLSSVYADIIQGIFMMLLATFTTLFCISKISHLKAQFAYLFSTFITDFHFLSQAGIIFIIGWAAASIGFSFSQPHLLDKIIAAKDEKNVKKARFVYMFFIQYTWIGMTLLGILIKLLYNNISDFQAEKALAIFIKLNSNPLLEGIVISGVFATIASTAASLNISISNYLTSDIFDNKIKINSRYILIIVFILTALPAVLLVKSSVFDLTIFAVSLGAVIAPCMLIKIYQFKHNQKSMALSLLAAMIITISFKLLHYSDNILYDIPAGTIVGLITNYTVFRYTIKKAEL